MFIEKILIQLFYNYKVHFCLLTYTAELFSGMSIVLYSQLSENH